MTTENRLEMIPRLVPAGTALIRTNPSEDQAVIALASEAQGLLTWAETRVIATGEDVRYATNDLSLIAKLKKALNEKIKEYEGPIKQHLDMVTATFKTITDPLKAADKITRDKISAYNEEQKRKAREAEEINQLRIEAARLEMKLKGELTEEIKLVEVIPPPPTNVRTEMGTLGTMKVRKYRVTNFAELPDQYKMENSALLNKVVKAGIPSIPGCELYFEESLRVSAR